jgi:hypothetical protein
MVKKDAMLGFKVGTQAKVNQILSAGSGAVHGTFYLAQDTHRLYIGNEDTSLSPVNEGVVTVANVAALSSVSAPAGSFYYATAENILCVYNGQNWVQINSDTDTSINTFTSAVSNGTVTISVTEKDKSNTPTGAAKDASFTITGSNGITITGNAADKTVNIAGNTYSIGATVESNEATVTLDSAAAGVADSSFKIKAGNGNVTIAADGTDVAISTKDTINSISDVSVTALASGFQVSVAESEGSHDEATFNPQITYGTADAQTGAKSSATFVNGTADLDVYTKGEVDKFMQGLDSMHYRGTIGTNGSASTDTTITNATFNLNPQLKIGDTFKLSSPVTVNGTTYPANTILIANGTEGADGFITQSTLDLEVIAATTNVDTTYSFGSRADATNNKAGITLVASAGASDSTLDVIGGNEIVVTGSGTASNKTQEITVTHEAHTAITGSSTTGTAISQDESDNTIVNVITGVTTNGYGHVTGVEKTAVTLKHEGVKLSDFDVATSVNNTNTSATITSTATMGNASNNNAYTKADSFAISSDNLTISSGAGTNEIKINLVWGEF